MVKRPARPGLAQSPLDSQQPLSSPRWLAAAFGGMMLFALLCVYLTFCLLFWQGQWQLVFHPSQTIASTPASVGMAYQEIQFDATESGVLQLHGWWVPAATTPSHGTLLLLHDGNGSLSDTVAQLQALHPLGMDLFAFDYRGFGTSLSLRPSEVSTSQDADAAWRYLTETRHLAGAAMVVDGVGLGATLAAALAGRHPEARALILERLRPPVLKTLRFDRQTRLLPVGLLFHDRFDAGPVLAQLPTPKLFLSAHGDATAAYYDKSAGPKEKTAFDSGYPPANYALSIQNFLTRYPARP